MARHPQGTPGKTSKPAPRGTNVTPAKLPPQAAAKAAKAVAKPKPAARARSGRSR